MNRLAFGAPDNGFRIAPGHWQDLGMASFSPISPVVPAGRMARIPQPVLGLPRGLELRPWHPRDADVLVSAGQDPAIRKWNRLIVPSPEHARRRIERMHERWQAEQAAI